MWKQQLQRKRKTQTQFVVKRQFRRVPSPILGNLNSATHPKGTWTLLSRCQHVTGELKQSRSSCMNMYFSRDMEGPQAVHGSRHGDTHGAEPTRLRSYRLCLVWPPSMPICLHPLCSSSISLLYMFICWLVNFLLLSTVYVVIWPSFQSRRERHGIYTRMWDKQFLTRIWNFSEKFWFS